jgi:hypothetical protein
MVVQWLNPQYTRVISLAGDYPLSVHYRAQEEARAIPHWSFSFQSDRVWE